MLQDTEPNELVRAVTVVAAGQALLAPEVTRRMLDRFARPEHEALALPQLTQREHEVLVALALGLSNLEIADVGSLSVTRPSRHTSATRSPSSMHAIGPSS